MRVLLGLLGSAVLAVVVLAFASAARANTTYDSVAIELMCRCGCGKVLSACDMPECTTQKNMNEQVKYMVGEGRGKDEIIKYFVDSYGEQVLAAPTKQGFNLTAWLMPFAVLAAGVAFVYLVVDKWVLQRRGGTLVEEAIEAATPAERNRYEERLKKELDQFEGGA
ncbi:MAG: cytochrome c-type biogenesis protein CcmH [Chloroflexi bacterium]|nr:cytochrome c-type biogenesis protein CcmH [Chloroflexota bacterium]